MQVLKTVFPSFLTTETVIPLRPQEMTSDFVKMYIGGAPNTMTGLQRVNGCIRGIKIGERVLKLQEEAQQTPGQLNFKITFMYIYKEKWNDINIYVEIKNESGLINKSKWIPNIYI